MNSLLTVALAAIAFAVLAVFIKKYNPEYAVLISAAGAIAVLLIIFKNVMPVFDYVNQLTYSAKIDAENITTLMKIIGFAITIQLSADVCRDSGETAMASKVEIAGRVGIIILSLPLIDSALKLITNLVS